MYPNTFLTFVKILRLQNESQYSIKVNINLYLIQFYFKMPWNVLFILCLLGLWYILEYFWNDYQVDTLSIQYLFYYLAVYDNLLPPSIVKHHVYKWWYFVSEYRCCILKSAELWNICFKSHKIYLLAVVEKLKCNLKCNNLPKFGFKMPIQI